jgi:hypothetical protein
VWGRLPNERNRRIDVWNCAATRALRRRRPVVGIMRICEKRDEPLRGEDYVDRRAFFAARYARALF